MVTDDERNMVIKKLREYEAPFFPGEQNSLNAFDAIMKCIYPEGDWPKTIREILDRIADLMVPPKPMLSKTEASG